MNIGCLISQLLSIYVIALFARIVLSWFPVSPGSPLATVYGVLYSVTEPVMAPVRNVVPSLGMLDISPILIFIGITIVQGIIC
ncbi:MAG: YggT family protein [Acidimicrobiales bacterium]